MFLQGMKSTMRLVFIVLSDDVKLINKQQKHIKMIENFENITSELTKDELSILPLLMKGFAAHSITNPIKEKEIVKKINERNLKVKLTSARLRKFVNHIRTNKLLPLIATSKGYYVCYDKKVIESQARSLRQRARSIERCADGMVYFLTTTQQ